uniref:Uncharacterized protein n=1 Tax=Nothobranchius kadleci TaxID=1051664 RepID=A0A1A8D3A4_NOTKA
MPGKRSRGISREDGSKIAFTRAAETAKLLQHECALLLELYRKREHFPAEVADGTQVSVPLPSSQLDTGSKLWRLHSALLQCRALLERAIAREDEELGDGEKGEYEERRERMKNRLSYLLNHTEKLLKATDGNILAPDLEGLELNGPNVLFKLKLWVYRIYRDVEHWSKVAVTLLNELSSENPNERQRLMRSTRGRVESGSKRRKWK